MSDSGVRMSELVVALSLATDLGFGPKLHGAISVPQLPLKKADVAPLAAKLKAVAGGQ